MGTWFPLGLMKGLKNVSSSAAIKAACGHFRPAITGLEKTSYLSEGCLDGSCADLRATAGLSSKP